MSINNS
jgi:hypothetical protein